jgi:hypothetical protein
MQNAELGSYFKRRDISPISPSGGFGRSANPNVYFDSTRVMSRSSLVTVERNFLLRISE